MKISIIGTGNVAYHLVKGFIKTNIKIDKVYGRNIEALKMFSQEFGVNITNDFTENKNSDIYILAVKDSAIANAASWFKNMRVVHTAGALDSKILSFYTNCYGVFYPFYSFRKEYNIDWSEIPIFLESCCSNFDKLLEKLANSLTKNYYFLSYKKRIYLHLSGVFVNNFVNHLLYHTKQILEKQGLKFEWVYPLLEETIKNIKEFDPYQIQTGPARRGDLISISNHQRLLEKDKIIQEIYSTLSYSILNLYNNKKLD